MKENGTADESARKTTREDESPVRAEELSDEAVVRLEEIGKWFGVSTNSIRNLIKAGQLPAIQVTPKLLRVRVGDAREYLRRQASTAREQRSAIDAARAAYRKR